MLQTFYIWGAFECAVAGIYWQDNLREILFGKFEFIFNHKFHYMTVQIEQSTLYLIRYCALSFVLAAGLLYGTFLIFKKKAESEKNNIARLVGAQFVILISLMIQILMNPAIDIVPICASLSILSVVISMLTDGFFGVTDWGHEWVFEQMEDIYIAVDCFYGFLDANASAKAVFPELERIREGENISEKIHYIFQAEKSVYKVRDKFYERNITDIVNNGNLVGHTILLRDISEQQSYLELVKKYNKQLKEEVAEKTEHIQLVQDSIITGIASVVESRDNSTGGHINRTSAVVNVAHFHHERWDGRGYPEGLKEEQIPVEARIMALADVFDALVSKRCYKEAFGFDRAFSIIEEGLGTQFDPVLGKLFLECRPELERLYIEMEEK